MKRFSRRAGLLLLVAVLLRPSPALAVPFTHASAGVRIEGQDPKSQQQSSPVGSAVSAGASDDKSGTGGIVANAVAFAGASLGRLQVSTSGSSTEENAQAASGAIASFDFLDLVMTGPGSAAIPVSFNLVVSGLITGELLESGVASPNGSVSLGSAVHVCPTCSDDVVNGRVTAGFLKSDPGFPFVIGGTGHLTGYTGGTLPITSSVFMVTPGTPFDLSMVLTASVLQVVEANLFLDLQNTVSFPTLGPVFNLPDGYTVNSLDGVTIVNNSFDTSAAVDEPAVLLLLVSGLGWIALLNSRRRRVDRDVP